MEVPVPGPSSADVEMDKEAEVDTNFENLPDEMITMILAYLPLENKKDARFVSKRWNAIVWNFIRFNILVTNDTLEALSRNSYKDKLNEIKVVLSQLSIPAEADFHPIMKESFETAKALRIMGSNNERCRNCCRRSSLTIDGEGIQRLLRICKEITTLEFDFGKMGSYHMSHVFRCDRIKLEHLIKLQIKITVESRKFDAVTAMLCIGLLRLKTPRLQELEVDGLYNQVPEMLECFFQCLVRNKLTLRGLKFVGSLSSGRQFNRGLSDQLAGLELERLEIEQKDTENGNSIMVDELLTGFQSLTVLKLDTDTPLLMDLCLQKILKNNASSLTNLELSVESPAEFHNFLNLTQLQSLKHLGLSSKYDVLKVHFPPTVQHLFWNARITRQWYTPQCDLGMPIPNIVSLTLGPFAVNTLKLDLLVNVLRNTRTEKSLLERVLIQIKGSARSNHILECALGLCGTGQYRVDNDAKEILVYCL